jgi:hypothetical protein
MKRNFLIIFDFFSSSSFYEHDVKIEKVFILLQSIEKHEKVSVKGSSRAKVYMIKRKSKVMISFFLLSFYTFSSYTLELFFLNDFFENMMMMTKSIND